MTNSANATETTMKLRRSRTDKMLTGVSGGWADYLGVEP
ncbi:PspC domain-containing protein, partial [Amycolatopsis sp. H20-H5]